MKKLSLLVLQLISAAAFCDGTERYFQTNRCYPNSYLNCYFNQQLDKKTFGIYCNGFGEQSRIRDHAVFLMKTPPTYVSEGLRISTGLEFIGSKDAEMTNGFTETIDIWRECDFKVSDFDSCKPINPKKPMSKNKVNLTYIPACSEDSK